ncbi:cyclic lactone autoinducer peptide [Romboutsia timonensis]|nr:cyclic lactone autoinducer peptide [Romboutsia timonensis]MDY3958128.1 cyclic lactone autoinducer peptide [Romboutsia timonensis]
MNFLFNILSELLSGVAKEASTYCVFMFFEPEIPKSLREE